MQRPICAAFSFSVLVALSFCHMLNDMQQSLLTGIYPILKDSYHLDFGQIGNAIGQCAHPRDVAVPCHGSTVPAPGLSGALIGRA